MVVRVSAEGSFHLANQLLDLDNGDVFWRQADLFGILKKLFFWNYPRNTWQWDALCVLILVFIFLTPKSCFINGEINGERALLSEHQRPTILKLFIRAEVVENAEDMAVWQSRIRTITGRTDAQVLEVRKRLAQDGKLIGYEVDIR